MANVKFTEFPSAATVGSTDIIPIVQGGVNKKATVSVFSTYIGSGFVPYVGATTDLNLDTHDLYTAKVWLKDVPNAGFGSLELTDGVLHFEDVDGHSMVTMEDGYLTIANASTIRALLNVSALSANRDFAFPNASGTLALTSQIPSVSGTTNYLPKFTGASALGNSIVSDNGTRVTIDGDFRVALADANINLQGTSKSYLLQIVDSDNRFRIYDNTSNAERFTITSAGNVGIGTSTPKSYASLTNNGQLISLGNIGVNTGENFRFNNYYNSGTTTDRAISTGFAAGINLEAGSMIFKSSASSVSADTNVTLVERMRITSAGNVGIGTTSPQNKLVISNGGAQGLEIGADATYNVNLAAYNRATAAYIPFLLDASKIMFGQGNVLIGTSTDAGFKLDVNGTARVQGDFTTNGTIIAYQPLAKDATRETGNGNSQGTAQLHKIVRQYSVVSLGTKLIIPFISQGNLNSTTFVRIIGLSARYNNNSPLGFSAEFALGHLNSLANLTTLNSSGNILTIAINGMNIEITFITGYGSSTADGVYTTIEYMTNRDNYSIDVPNITMN